MTDYNETVSVGIDSCEMIHEWSSPEAQASRAEGPICVPIVGLWYNVNYSLPAVGRRVLINEFDGENNYVRISKLLPNNTWATQLHGDKTTHWAALPDSPIN